MEKGRRKDLENRETRKSINENAITEERFHQDAPRGARSGRAHRTQGTKVCTKEYLHDRSLNLFAE